VSAAREKVVGRIADHLTGSDPGHPLRVAVDGVTAAGKTTFAHELAAAIERRGRPVVRLSMDGFHHRRAHRYRQGRDSAAGYYEDAYDNAGFVTGVLAPLGPDGDLGYVTRIHDLETDEAVREQPRAAAADAVLVVDGTFLQRPELAPGWDHVVYLDTSYELAQERGSRRDAAMFGGPEAAAAAFERRYHAACRRYGADVDPAAVADVVVGNDDLERPVLRRIGGPPGATAALFSYGTLQQDGVQQISFGRLLSGEPDTLPGYWSDWVTITDPEVIAASGSDRHPLVRPLTDGAALPEDAAAGVPGTVLTLTSAELAAADDYEVDGYRRVAVTLGSGRRAWVYLAAGA
jgi:uridine kinase